MAARERRSFASGFINAGGSFGQFVFAPLSQAMIAALGWMSALWTLAVASLTTIPLAFKVGNKPKAVVVAGAPKEITLKAQLRVAFKDRSYWCLHAGFFTCGFHIAFLVTHLPGEVNCAGCPLRGRHVAGDHRPGQHRRQPHAWAAGQPWRMKMLLFWMYFTRALAVLAYLAMPKTEWTFYAFAAVLGATWLATVPPTAGLTAKLFGTRYLATLFGLTLLSHQIGGFFGAWLGGIAVDNTGNYQWMWYADIVLARCGDRESADTRSAPAGSHCCRIDIA